MSWCSPSMLKIPSVTMRTRLNLPLFSESTLSKSSRSICLNIILWSLSSPATLIPSIMLLWFSSSEITSVSGCTTESRLCPFMMQCSTAMFAANADENIMPSSLPWNFASAFSRSRWICIVPEINLTAPGPAPYVFEASSSARLIFALCRRPR